ncbi:putative lipoprotein thiredoxin [Hydrogenimonas sp.]|nr:putative lipoprotein thiredoxin [Hydrogenimonas sp.]
MKLKIVSLCAIVLAASLLTGCTEKREESTKSEKVEKRVKSFVLKDTNTTVKATLNDEGISFDVEEPVVLLNFFATWCPPCKAEIPHLVSLQNRYAGKIKVVAVLVEEHVPQRVIKRFKQDHEINYFVSNSAENMKLASVTADMLHQPQNFSIPMMVLFVNGKYFRHYIGMVPEEMLESDIKDALKEAGR